MKTTTYFVALAGLFLLAGCALSQEQIAAISESVRMNLEASGKFNPEQSEAIGKAVGDAVAEFGAGGEGWRGVLSVVGDVALTLILGAFGISRGARVVRAVKQAGTATNQ